MNKKQSVVIALLSAAAFILAFLLSGRLWFRLDLTKNKAYTLSEVSQNLYKEIPEPVKITYYISDRLDTAHPVPGEITDLLREYADRSRGMIRFEKRDPAKANKVTEVEELGIVPQQIQVVEKDETAIATVYTGLLIEYLEKREIIPVVFSLDTLEYDVTSRIRSLVRDRTREVGIISADPSKQFAQDYGLLNQELLYSGWKVTVINSGDDIPQTLSCLFVLGGAESLDEWALYRIDRFLKGGGKVLFALDGVSVDTRSLAASPVADKGLLAMLASYGVVLRQVLVLDRTALNVQFQMQTQRGTQYNIVRYPEWFAVLEQSGNKDHPVSSRWSGLDLYWPSPLELHAPDGVEALPLFTSTPEAWLQTKEFITNPQMVYLFAQEEEETRGTKILGASLSGIFPSAFAGKPKPVREGSNEELPDLPEETRPSRIIVVGDADFAGAFMQATRAESRNLDFLLRTADWLGSDDDIIGIRNRQGESGRLDKIRDPEKKAAAMNVSRAVNVFVLPALVILAGLFLSWKRWRRGNGKED
jgi:gliding-associated putative ABC transporter substrate-binding component GldG